jgi:hypothetical protein
MKTTKLFITGLCVLSALFITCSDLDDSPLILTTVIRNPIPRLPDITIKAPVEFQDITVYYDIKTRLIYEDPEPAGTIVISGIPIQINGEWTGLINMLLSIFGDLLGNANTWL